MELIDGENLDQLIAQRTPIPLPLKLVYATQACSAFDYAHKRGLIHRDIKPGNIMVNKEGTLKVVDFGIARVLEASKTQTGLLMGTFAYMSPERRWLLVTTAEKLSAFKRYLSECEPHTQI